MTIGDFAAGVWLLQVHMVNDESRGATMEAVVSRMKTVQSALAQGANTNTVRFIAVSATIPNVEDVGIQASDMFDYLECAEMLVKSCFFIILCMLELQI